MLIQSLKPSLCSNFLMDLTSSCADYSPRYKHSSLRRRVHEKWYFWQAKLRNLELYREYWVQGRKLSKSHFRLLLSSKFTRQFVSTGSGWCTCLIGNAWDCVVQVTTLLWKMAAKLWFLLMKRLDCTLSKFLSISASDMSAWMSTSI